MKYHVQNVVSRPPHCSCFSCCFNLSIQTIKYHVKTLAPSLLRHPNRCDLAANPSSSRWLPYPLISSSTSPKGQLVGRAVVEEGGGHGWWSASSSTTGFWQCWPSGRGWGWWEGYMCREVVAVVHDSSVTFVSDLMASSSTPMVCSYRT